MFDSAEPESRVGKGTSPFTSRARDTLRRPAGPDETRLVPIGFLRDTSTSSHAEGRTYELQSLLKCGECQTLNAGADTLTLAQASALE